MKQARKHFAPESGQAFFGGIPIQITSDFPGVVENLPWRWTNEKDSRKEKAIFPPLKIEVVKHKTISKGKPYRITFSRSGRSIHANIALERADWAVPIVEAVVAGVLAKSGWVEWHSSGVVSGGKAVLFPGPSGCGKSTTAYLLSRAGFHFLADDSLFLRQAGNKSFARSTECQSLFRDLHQVSKLNPKNLTRLRPAPEAEPKWMVPSADDGVTNRQYPIRAILFPVLSQSKRPRIQRLRSPEAFSRCLKHMQTNEARPFLDPGAMNAYFQLCSTLSSSVKMGVLSVAGDESELAELIQEFLRDEST